MAGLVPELTVTNFVFRRSGGNGRLLTGLIWHARLGGWLPRGGHVEPGETLDRAAQRETEEELGCRTRFLPSAALPLPAGFPHQPGAAPWWVIEMSATADSHTPARHRHQDHVFVSCWLEDAGQPETDVTWLSEPETASFAGLSQDSRPPEEWVAPPADRLLPGAMSAASLLPAPSGQTSRCV